MEAKGLVQHGASSLPPSSTGRRGGGKRCPAVVVAAVVTREIDGREVRKGATVYEDMWFSRLAIRHLSQSVQTSTGFKNDKEGYESLIEAAAMVSQNFNTNKQQELVIQALHIAFPKPILSLIKRLLPSSKFTREFFAVFTTVFFAWLVGHCEVKESEFEGRKERNVVHIPKCRFLEGSKCVGMCVNLCKIPSQRFIEESFGIPVSMIPNFEDMSCDMVFGVRPPAAGDDPSTKQPCYSLCKAKQQHFTQSSSS